MKIIHPFIALLARLSLQRKSLLSLRTKSIALTFKTLHNATNPFLFKKLPQRRICKSYSTQRLVNYKF